MSIKDKINSWKTEGIASAKASMSTKASHLGSYNIAITVVVLAIAIVINLFAGLVPANLTQLDISSAKLYSVTSNTKVVVNGMDKDVTIYWVVQAGQEDGVIEKLLAKYEALNSHIKVIKKNPDIYPTFATQYTSGSVSNNDLIVECGERYRYINIDDIYEYDTTDYYYTGTYETYFDGEGEITSAIDYVISDKLTQLYVLTGHGEQDLSDTISKAISKENIEITEFSLLTVDEIPEKADCVLIYGPTSDISEKEREMLTDYVDNGGSLMVFSGPAQDAPLTQLNELAESCGIAVNDGVVIESDRSYYAFSTPYMLLPDIENNEITAPLLNGTRYVIMPIAAGLTLNEDLAESLLSVTSTAFSKKAGYALSTYDKEEGDTDGPFSLAAAATTEAGVGKVVWIASDYLLDDTYNAYSSDANMDFAMNSLSWLSGETESISIRSKSLDNEYLTISEAQGSLLKVILVGIVPAAFLLMGIFEVIKRRKMA